MTFAKQLRRWRGTLTRQQFAERIGVSWRTLEQWEQGRREPDALAREAIEARVKKGNGR